MAVALGLTLTSTQEPASPKNSPKPASDSADDPMEGKEGAEPLSHADYAQHVEINVAGERATSEIADIVRQQSDGHALLVIKYYAQGLTQASISFALSMTFAVVGFGLITIAVIQVLTHPEQPVLASATALVGVVNQALSSLFFRRADKGRDLMMQLVDKLRTDREHEMKFVAGLATIEQVTSGGLQDALRASVALTFTGSPIKLEHLASLVNSGALGVAGTREMPNVNVFGAQTVHGHAVGNGDEHIGGGHEFAS